VATADRWASEASTRAEASDRAVAARDPAARDADSLDLAATDGDADPGGAVLDADAEELGDGRSVSESARMCAA
jgi:hypothetical protein